MNRVSGESEVKLLGGEIEQRVGSFVFVGTPGQFYGSAVI